MPRTHKYPVKNDCIYAAFIFPIIYAGELGGGGEEASEERRNQQRKGGKSRAWKRRKHRGLKDSHLSCSSFFTLFCSTPLREFQEVIEICKRYSVPWPQLAISAEPACTLIFWQRIPSKFSELSIHCSRLGCYSIQKKYLLDTECARETVLRSEKEGEREEKREEGRKGERGKGRGGTLMSI